MAKKNAMGDLPMACGILRSDYFSSQSSTCNGHPNKKEPNDKGEN